MKKMKEAINYFKLNVQSIECVPESYGSEVYKLTLINKESLYIKIPYSKVKLYREYAVLNQLKKIVRVPEILGFWEGNEEMTGAFLLEDLKGVPCNKKISVELAYDIGIHHAKIHSVSMESYGNFTEDGFEALKPHDWHAFVRDKFFDFAPSVKEVLSADLYEKSIRHFEEHIKALPAPEPPAIIHMDFRPGNILVNNDYVVGIIDFESSRSAATEMDFTKINRDIFKKYPNTKEAYIEGYETIRPFIDLDRILPFYAFYDAFNSIGWSYNRGLEKHKGFFEENLVILKSFIEK
ncbi:phosphotransferase family protein [Cytobacillus horneckiae]|uniref:Aminoglycoside phosphotransferase family protein n=1 Tax=Cytobacillus horneckiae TaxID=549687 RepID=A0A2N0ZFG0_9BACI|nr:aminoglycoside phosphotransferase family protein [Cytobacillus horneckiae]MEC1154264.1 aminoglycoside phosphotransferase family protein [Cytobacillus horneckiae]MED2937600.1 aminoglycoside phosphotransferase family protein [Cytobacillus horneckiae]PKG28250.1 aminoglycoside phosphotransferase family protein [Cytobacillus horneckiae]